MHAPSAPVQSAIRNTVLKQTRNLNKPNYQISIGAIIDASSFSS